ncbi:MAG: tellurium resistance protein TerC [Syntrophus sp. (in: bacteria)]|nr:tellurium resistance protein TerC [Syntrophus sp. (in: bacteria)]
MANIMNMSFGGDFIVNLLTIVFVNIILSGDNAIVIAMAVRSLPEKQKKKGILFGTIMAVFLRIALTFFAAQLLNIPLMKFIGGILILWIAVKLFMEDDSGKDANREPVNVWKAITTILMADLIMSVDNVLAVAGASNGSLALLVLGLGTSIPIIIFASSIISKLMERFPVVLFIGAAVLGRVAGEMIAADPYIIKLLGQPGHFTAYGIQILCAAGVLGFGMLLARWKASKKPILGEQLPEGPFYVDGWDIL